MIQQIKHSKFILNGYIAFKQFQQKALDKKNHLSEQTQAVKEDIIGFSHFLYEDMLPVVDKIKSHYQKSGIPNYISNSIYYGLETVGEIKKDINPFNEKNQEYIRNIDKKHFLAVGTACFLLSSINLRPSQNNETVSVSDISLNLSSPKENPINHLTHSSKPEFMSPIFHSKLEAFIKLLGITEVKANIFYPDNLGVATAYGWNPPKNSLEFNVNLAHKIGMSSQQIKSIEKISDNSKVQSVPKSLKKVVLSDRQIRKSAEFMLEFYEKELLKVMEMKAKQNGKSYPKILKSYQQLPNNQQVVMIHMAYKVGISNLLKYNQFYKRLFTYMEQPTTINLEKVTNNFEYSYKTRTGETLHDVRVETLHNEFFNLCSINDSKIKEKEAIKQSINSCRKFVAAKTIKFNNKG